MLHSWQGHVGHASNIQGVDLACLTGLTVTVLSGACMLDRAGPADVADRWLSSFQFQATSQPLYLIA